MSLKTISTAPNIKKQIYNRKKDLEVLLLRKQEIIGKIQEKNAEIEALEEEYEKAVEKENTGVNWTLNKYHWSDKAQKLLVEKFKLKEFRHEQLAAINCFLAKKDLILIMPTGGGKSLTYQLTALISPGITLVVSPLLSLIEDQLLALKKLEIKAVSANSQKDKADLSIVAETLKTGAGNIKIIYVTPEWLAKSKRFMAQLQKCYERGALSQIAIDEVHCCAEWGHDFRPDYKFLNNMKKLFPKTPIIGLTATATRYCTKQVQTMLDIPGCTVLRSSYNRRNLFYEVRIKPRDADSVVAMLEKLIIKEFKDQSGIIYTATINECEVITVLLKKRGLSVASYHASMDAEARYKVHNKWLQNQVQVIIATVAFGMGIDKPDVRFVIHHSIPKSVENYYQESGRAGRDDKPAFCILLYSYKDVFKLNNMVAMAFQGSSHLFKVTKYCMDYASCRRSLFAEHFDETWSDQDCNNMCDNCKYPKNLHSLNVSAHFQTCREILHKEKQSKLTPKQLVDAFIKWKKGGIKQTLSPDKIESIIMYLVLLRHLHHEIKFTAYKTITYLKEGQTQMADMIMMPYPVGNQLMPNYKEIKENHTCDNKANRDKTNTTTEPKLLAESEPIASTSKANGLETCSRQPVSSLKIKNEKKLDEEKKSRKTYSSSSSSSSNNSLIIKKRKT